MASGVTKDDGTIPRIMKRLTLVPVEVFGGCDHPGCHDTCDTFGYGLCDAVGPGYSDCNRAIGRIYRVEDLTPENGDYMIDEGKQVRVHVWIAESDAEFFTQKFGED